MARLQVIEDNLDNLELMSYLLKANGHQVSTALDGAEGLAAIRLDPPDLVVCDVHMPNVDGYEVARQLKADPALRHIPLLAVTALAMVGDCDKVLAAGFDGYLAKPIDPPEFARQVESYLLPGHAAARPPLIGQEASTPVADRPAASSQGRILAVDDITANLDVLRAILEPSGFSMTQARSVRQALAILEHASFDLILSDLHMPHEDGYYFLRAVKTDERWRAIPFICISATVWSDADRSHMLGLGAVRFVQRPVEPQQLLAEIMACLSSTKK